jgi:hypothetical protein
VLAIVRSRCLAFFDFYPTFYGYFNDKQLINVVLRADCLRRVAAAAISWQLLSR